MVASKCSRNNFISEKYKRVQSLSYIYSKIVSLCNCTHLPMTAVLLETFPEAIFDSFSSCSQFLMMSVTSQKRHLFKVYFSRRNGRKSAGARSRGNWGCSRVVTLFFANQSLTKTDRCGGALLWRIIVGSPLFGSFPSDRIARRRRMLMHISLFTAATPVRYTREFL